MGRIDLSKRISLIVAATVVAGNLAFADVSKNCITDIKLSNDGSNINVNIYTTKPYTDSVVVSKKEGNRYVLLVPETTSSLKSIPKVTGAGNISVNMQTVSAGRGYTKITIESDKALNVVPKTITSSASVKPVSQPVKPQPVVQKVVNQPSSSKPVVKSPLASKVQKQPSTLNGAQKSVSKASAEKPIKQQSVKSSTPIPASQPKVSVKQETRNNPLEILEKEVKTDSVSDFNEQSSDPLLEKTIKDNDEIINRRKMSNRKFLRKNSSVTDSKTSVKDGIKLVLNELQQLSLWKLLMLASAITFPIIVIMFILNLDKRINKRVKSVRKEDDVEVMERALRENVNAIRAQKALEQSSSFNSIDAMLDKVEETPEIDDAYSVPDSVQDNSFAETVIEDSDFEIDEEQDVSLISDSESTCDVNLPQYEVDNSFADTDDSISLDSFENIDFSNSSQIDVEQSPEPQTELVPYNPDGVLADFSNLNDKEFFDELVLQSFAENDVNNLPNNIPADEIFDVITESDALSSLSDTILEGSYDEEVSLQNNEEENDVTMLNEAKINENTGLYLVNYDNCTSLVGHISDEYFVLKKFDEIVNGNIILKQAEKTENSLKYLVRVGHNKMIVEVKNDSMSRLIDL